MSIKFNYPKNSARSRGLTDGIFFFHILAAAAFQFKGLAVGAGNNGRIVFMSANLDLFKAAVIVAAAVVLAVVYCTFDRSVCKFSSHFGILLLKNWYFEINFFSYTCFYFSAFSQEYVCFFMVFL